MSVPGRGFFNPAVAVKLETLNLARGRRPALLDFAEPPLPSWLLDMEVAQLLYPQLLPTQVNT